MPEEAIECPECGFGVFEPVKVAYSPGGASADELRGDSVPSGSDSPNLQGEVNALISLLSEAYSWGKNNSWPVYEKYPQYAQIRIIGSRIHGKGNRKAMQSCYYNIRAQNFDLADMLDHFWHGVGGWMV
jgi:hypothetical protein